MTIGASAAGDGMPQASQRIVVKQRDNTGLYAFNEKFVEVIPPKGGQRHLSILLHALESLKASGTANVGSMIWRNAATSA